MFGPVAMTGGTRGASGGNEVTPEIRRDVEVGRANGTYAEPVDPAIVVFGPQSPYSLGAWITLCCCNSLFCVWYKKSVGPPNRHNVNNTL